MRSNRWAWWIAAVVLIVALVGGVYVGRRLLTGGAAVTSKDQAEATLIVKLINRQRVKYHLAPFKRDPALDRLAVEHSLDMKAKDYFEHDAPASAGGITFAERFHSIHPRRALGEENIAWGTGPFGSASGLVASWMASPGHRANILNPAARRIGVGIVRGRFQGQPIAVIGTQDFSN